MYATALDAAEGALLVPSVYRVVTWKAYGELGPQEKFPSETMMGE